MLKRIGNYFVRFFQKSPLIAVAAGVTFAGLVASSILCLETPAQVVKVLPLFISIIVMLLQTEANRYAFLLGSINSIFYAIVYTSFTLYTSAISALCLSFPIQMLTFFRWNKRKYKLSTVFKKLSWKMRVAGLLAGVTCVFLLNFVMGKLGSEYMLLDNVSNTVGIFNYVLTYFSYIEYPYINIVGSLIGSTTYIKMLSDDITILPYLISNCYNLLCIVKTAISVGRLYREQQGLGCAMPEKAME